MTLPRTLRSLFRAISRPVVTRKPTETGEETGNSATGQESRLPDSSPFTNLTPPDPNPHKRVPVKDGHI